MEILWIQAPHISTLSLRRIEKRTRTNAHGSRRWKTSSLRTGSLRRERDRARRTAELPTKESRVYGNSLSWQTLAQTIHYPHKLGRCSCELSEPAL